MSRLKLTVSLLFALLIVALNLSCGGSSDKVVTITYHPLKLGNNLFVGNNDSGLNAGHKRLWFVYCIIKIKNKDGGAVNFTLDIDKFRVAGEPLVIPQEARNSWAFDIQNTTVNAGTNKYDIGTIVFSASSHDLNAPSWVDLHYAASGSESVLMDEHVTSQPDPVLDNVLNQFSLPQTCVSGNAIPD